jgi:hypothetical protein
VTYARDIWWTLDSANAFVSPGVNSRGELVPSHGASRRRLGDYSQYSTFNMLSCSCFKNLIVYFLHACMHLKSRRVCTNFETHLARSRLYICVIHQYGDISILFRPWFGIRIRILSRITVFDYICMEYIGFGCFLFLKIIVRNGYIFN